MADAVTVVWDTINEKEVEEIFRLAKSLQDDGTGKSRLQAGAYGLRVFQHKEPKAMKVLERCAEVLRRMDDNQNGEERRRASTQFAFKFPPAVVNMFREAYVAADKGVPEPAFSYLYAACAAAAGHGFGGG